MNSSSVTLDQVVQLARQLTPREQVQLIAQVIPDLEATLSQVASSYRPLRSVYGLCQDLGPAPSAEEIDEARRALFTNFPRTDIA